MKIRVYEENDNEMVLYLHKNAMEKIGAYKGDGSWDDDLKDIKGTYMENGGLFLVGEENNIIICMGAFKKYKDGFAEVKRMRVLPEYQGRGYGKEILAELEKEARKAGYKGFVLETSVVQVGAQILYKKSGFNEYFREKIDGFDCIWFKKEFSSSTEMEGEKNV